MAHIKLIKVAKRHYWFLYALLEERPKEASISHKKMPTYKQHCAFNDKKPYRYDYIIAYEGFMTGRVYLTRQHEIGIHVAKVFQGLGIASRALAMFYKKHTLKRVYANIAPQNKASQRFFTKHGFTLIQYTYVR